MNEFLVGLGIDLASGAVLDWGRALIAHVRPEQRSLLRQTLRGAVEDAADAASAPEGPAETFLELVCRPEVLDTIAALALASSQSRGVTDELDELLLAVSWDTSNVDRDRFYEAVIPASRRAVMSAGRAGGALASLALNLRMDELQQQLGFAHQPSKITEGLSKSLPPPVQTMLAELFTTGDESAPYLAAWLERFDPYTARTSIADLISDPPRWLNEATARAWKVVAAISEAYDDLKSAASALVSAADRGAQNAPRLIARAAYLQFAQGEDNQELLARLDPTATQDPFVSVLTSAARAEWRPVLEAGPQSVEPVEDARLLRMMRVVALVHLGDWQTARSEAEALHQEWPDITGIGLLTAKVLLGSVETLEGEQDRQDAVSRAHRLAITTRDARRLWRGPSHESVAVAAQAAVLSHNYELALQMCLPPPDGQASPQEAASPEVRQMAAQLAAMTGRITLAHDLSQGLDDPAMQLTLGAIAEAENRKEDAARHARAALEAATDPIERRQALMILAGAGALEAADVDNLPKDVGTLLNAINLAESERLEDAYALLRREGGPDTAHFERLMAMLLSRTGDPELAAQRLVDAASRFGDPTLRVEAAMQYAKAADWDTASSLALEAVSELSSETPGWRDAHTVLIDASARRGDWPNVERYAKALLAADPDADPARWALTLALVRRRRADEAWVALNRAQGWPDPTDPWQASLLVALLTQFRPSADTAKQLLDLADAFNDDEQLRAQVIISLVQLPEVAVDADERLLKRAQRHSADFLERFPTSVYLRSVSGSDDDELVERLSEILKPAAERWRSASKLVANGAPAGLLAVAAGRPYAAIWPHRAPGHLPMTAEDTRHIDADNWLTRTPVVAVDASAIHTLTLVGELWPHLRASTKELLITEDAANDLIRARESLALRSQGSLSWNLDADRISMTEAAPDIASLLQERTAQMAASLRWMRVVQWKELQKLSEFDQQEMRPWIGLVDYCATTGTALYCDDVGLRRFAREYGVKCFDSTALITELAKQDEVMEADLERLMLTLASEFAVDLPNPQHWVERLIARDGLESLAASYQLSRAPYWQPEPLSRLDWVRSLLQGLAGDHPDLLARWTAMSALGLSRSSGSTRLGFMLFVEQLLGSTSASIRADLFYAARSVAAELETQEPSPALVQIILELTGDIIPVSDQAQFVLQLFSEISDEDRAQIAAALLKPAPGETPRTARGPKASNNVSSVQAQVSEARKGFAQLLFNPPAPTSET